MTISPNRSIPTKWRRGSRAYCGAARRRSAVLAVACFCAATSAGAQEITYDAALAAARSGDYVASENYFSTLASRDADNAELWFRLGLAQRMQGKNADAADSQRRALSIEPANADALLELARLLYFDGKYDEALKRIKEAAQARPDDAEIKELQISVRRAAAAPKKEGADYAWQFDAGYEHSDFSRRPMSDWSQTFAQIALRVKGDAAVRVRTDSVERFDAREQYYEIGVDKPLKDGAATVGASVGHTPGGTFYPTWRYAAFGEARVFRGDGDTRGDARASLYVRHDRYDRVNATVVKPGIAYDFAKNWTARADYIHVIDENDDHLSGWSSRVDWQTPAEPLRLFVGASNAPEMENAATVRTRSAFGGAAVRLTDRVTLHASYAREDRNRSYVRHVLSGAASIRF